MLITGSDDRFARIWDVATGSRIGPAIEHSAGILSVAGSVVREQTGVVLDLLVWHPVLVAAPLGMTLLGALAGLLPAMKAYSTDVARNLLPTS